MSGIETINVEEIMEQIRRDIREKGYTGEMLSFRDVDCQETAGFSYCEDEYISIVNELNQVYNVPWHRPLNQGGFKAFVKKIIRKMSGFLIAPISDGQNYFNSQVTKGFNQMAGYINKQQQVIWSCQQRIDLLETKMEQLEQEIWAKDHKEET